MIRHIPIQGPFRLATALQILTSNRQVRRQPASESSFHRFSLEIPGGAADVQIYQAEAGADLKLVIRASQLEEEDADCIRNTIARMFSLNVDATDFFLKASEDPHLRFALSIMPDLRPVLYPNVFEAVISFMIRKRFEPGQTIQLLANLREVCGIVPPEVSGALPAFPGKLTFMAISDRLLAVAGLNEPLIRQIRQFASSLLGHPDPVEQIYHVVDPEKAKKTLLGMPGISPHMVDMLLLKAYGFQDLLLNDSQFHRAVQRIYRLREYPDERTVKRLAQPFIPWRSYWMYLLLAADSTSVIV